LIKIPTLTIPRPPFNFFFFKKFPDLLKQQSNCDIFFKSWKILKKISWPKKTTKKPMTAALNFFFFLFFGSKNLSFFLFPFVRKKSMVDFSIQKIDQKHNCDLPFFKTKRWFTMQKESETQKKNYKKIELRTLLQLLFKKLKPKSKKPTIRKKQL